LETVVPAAACPSVTRNVTEVDWPGANVPPADAVAPVPSCALTTLATIWPWSSPGGSVLGPAFGPDATTIVPGTYVVLAGIGSDIRTLIALSSPVLVAVTVYCTTDPGAGVPPPTTWAVLVTWMLAWCRSIWVKNACGQYASPVVRKVNWAEVSLLRNADDASMMFESYPSVFV
jgi:hypothetical protein